MWYALIMATLLLALTACAEPTPTPDPTLVINEYGGVGDRYYGPDEPDGPYKYDPPSAEKSMRP